ncbi:MAG: hypothetical protein AABX27_04360 [Nanoarchaeota archaeon]
MKPINAILGASVLAAALGMGCTWASEARMAAEREGWHNVEVGDYHTESTICKYVFEESATAYEVKGVLDDGKKVEGVVCCISCQPCKFAYWNYTLQ